MKKKLIFMIGIPGCGKSTYLKDMHPVVETDKLRKIHLGNVNDWSKERFIFDTAIGDILQQFELHDTVYLDSTMVESKHRESMLEKIGGRLDVEFEAVVFPADMQLSIQRIESDLDVGKDRANPIDYIQEYYNHYIETINLIEGGQVDFKVTWV